LASLARRSFLSSFRTRSSETAEATADYWIRVHRRAMACRFEIALSGEDARHVPAAREALDDVDLVEAALTVFRGTSALVEVNRRAAHGPVAVNAELFDLLALCRELHAATEGAFDITATPLSRCWGFLKREGRLPSSDEIAAARADVGMAHVELDAERRTVRFARPGLELNLGAIGKGYALDRVAARLGARGVAHALVSAGGSSVRALGGRPGDWAVDVASPLAAGGRLGALRLRDAALGTSGAGYQHVEIEGRRYGHVLDPRTGWPAEGVLSVTVVADCAAYADALSTAFLVGGPDLAARYCAGHPATLAVMTLDDDVQTPLLFGSHPGAVLTDWRREETP
jgi:thiamine biosynthesis lipoprotein